MSGIALAGCAPPGYKDVEGTVVSERYSRMLVKVPVGIFANETVAIKPQYVLVVDTPKRRYNISVYEYSKPVAALAEAIDEGDKIKFRSYHYPTQLNHYSRNYCSRDNICSIDSDNIEVLPKTNK